MKLLEYSILSIIILLIGITTSCDKNKDDRNSIITISNNITSPTTWEEDKSYIIDKENLYISAELTIQPGAIIKLMSNGNIILNSGGKITANGTSSKPIIFTSIKDDNHGSDTNNDGDNTIPAAGDWGYINLNGSQNNTFSYCQFLYGGRDKSNPATIDVSSEANAVFSNCTFAHNSGGLLNSIYVGALNASNASKNTTITDCKFYGNNVPVTINAEMSMDNSNSFSNDKLGNKYNGIFVMGNDISTDVSWFEDEVAFVVTDAILCISREHTLTLGNNVVIKFAKHSSMKIISGEEHLANHNGTGVFFTSLNDDELKGDTNGDSNESAPAIADWTGILIENWETKSEYANWDNIFYNDPHPPIK